MEPIADPGALGDELIARVDEELEVGGEMRHPKARQAWLTQGHPGDRHRVGRVVLATAPARPPSKGRQMRGKRPRPRCPRRGAVG